ncbi:MAG: DUF2357 domain-containing protein [Chloroflexia bacterium]|nr:DUF2357 domain-containing protein [Chloroflexia bacterium]
MDTTIDVSLLLLTEASPPKAPYPLTGGPIGAVPDDLATRLVPARWVVHEWADYWYVDPEATEVRVGSRTFTQQPAGSGNYLIRFENQLGLATIRAFDEFGQRGDAVHVEVIASKFQTPRQSVDFLQSTLAALYARIASMPFVLGASTERLVRESPAPPNPLFTYYFFVHHGAELIRAIQAVLGRPYQKLTSDPELVRPHEVRRIDRESMIRMLQAGHSSPTDNYRDTRNLSPLERLRPERVWQQIPVETFDTPENRYVLAICRWMVGAWRGLQRQVWYRGADVPDSTRARIDGAGEHLGMLTMDDRFAPLGPMVVTPTQSRVLQRKDGYRELNVLWQRFQRSREPIFEQMQNAIELRSVDKLYELWVLFELIDMIAVATDEKPVLTPEVDVFGTPVGGYRARFGARGTLRYDSTKVAYSGIWLRPDYLWKPAVGDWVVFDAKFRMDKPEESTDEETGEISYAGMVTSKNNDWQKMHTYRDGLTRVRAAVVLYPGEERKFRDTMGNRRDVEVEDLLFENLHGVGAIPLSPIRVSESDGPTLVGEDQD